MTHEWLGDNQPPLSDTDVVLISNGLMFPNERGIANMEAELGRPVVNERKDARELRRLRGDPNWRYY